MSRRKAGVPLTPPFGSASVAAGGSALLFLFMFLGRKPRTLERYEGIIFLLLYAGYLGYLVTCRI